MKSRAICTIVSRNYLAYARTLANSFRSFHPDDRIFVLLVDAVDGIEPEREPFELIDVRTLGIRDFPAMAFKYDVLELNTAVKPFLLERLLLEHGVDEVLYLDPDILVTAPLTPVFDRLSSDSILLTPHVMRPYQDDKRPHETDLLRAGAYNLGFIGLAKTAQSLEMLRWWQQRCYDGCVIRFEDGLFVDQKWMDLVPSFFSETGILREPGCNVAYWNLHERTIEWSDTPRCNGRPLYFFHFSGYRADRIEDVSKHQNRFRLEQRPDLRTLFEHYRELLEQSGMRECAGLPYAFGSFDDGSEIAPLMRKLYFSLSPEERRRFGDPFSTQGADSFQRWMRQPALLQPGHQPRIRNRRWVRMKTLVQRALAPLLPDGPVDRVAYFLHQSELSVRSRFPDVFGRDRRPFLRWLRKHRAGLYRSNSLDQFEHDLVPDRQLRPIHRFLDPSLLPGTPSDSTSQRHPIQPRRAP